jgi:hypothetical protein
MYLLIIQAYWPLVHRFLVSFIVYQFKTTVPIKFGGSYTNTTGLLYKWKTSYTRFLLLLVSYPGVTKKHHERFSM